MRPATRLTATLAVLAGVACASDPALGPQAPTAAPRSTASTSTSEVTVIPPSGQATAWATPPLSTPTPAAMSAVSLDAGAAPPVSRVRPLPQYPSPLPAAKPTTLALTTGGSERADTELAAGDEALEKGDISGAATHYAAARAAAPRSAAPIVGLARVRIARVGAPLDYGAAKGSSEVAGAVTELRRAVQLEPTFAPGQVELGRALLLLADGAGALEALRRGAELASGEAEAHSAYGVALLATGKGEEALAAFLRAAELDPGSFARHGNLGTILLMRGRVPDAVREYELQLELAKDDPMAHADLGAALLHSGSRPDVARGTRELQSAVRLDPKRASFRSNLGYALQLQGKVPEAIAQYREAIRLDDKFAGAWINLATALARDPKTRAEARAALERARRFDPTDPRVNANLDELDELEGVGARDGGAGRDPRPAAPPNPVSRSKKR